MASKKFQVVQEIHRSARKNFDRRKYSMYGISETIQADLIEMQPYKRENRNYRYILIVVDIFSKMAFAEPLKEKTGKATCVAMERIIKKILRFSQKKICNLNTDEGREFFNSSMKQLLDKYKINHYSTFSIKKAAIVERLIRTIKKKLYMRFSLQGSHRWLNILQEVIDSYNDTR